MKLRDLLKIESVVDKRAVPSDMLELDIEYFSESRQESIDIMDMHLVHFIRVYAKMHEDQYSELINAAAHAKPDIVQIDGIKYRRVNDAE
jgi:hypothetical protein